MAFNQNGDNLPYPIGKIGQERLSLFDPICYNKYEVHKGDVHCMRISKEGWKNMKKDFTQKHSYDYLTNFYRIRSIIALCCGICTLILAFYGIIAGVIRSIAYTHTYGFTSFIYFTMISNTLALFAVAFVIPYAVEGIKKKRFVLPKWVAMINFISATSIAIVLAFVLSVISWTSPQDAFGGINLILHIHCPFLILISFFQVENRYKYSMKDCLIGCIPFFIYAIVYYIEVGLIGEKNGGWPDIYHVQEYVPSAVAAPILMIFGLIVSCIIAAISNYLTKKREKKMFSHWEKDIDSIEAKIEAYGLGNMMSNAEDKNNIVVPMDILEYIAQKTNVKTEELIKSYIKGVIVGQKNKLGDI